MTQSVPPPTAVAPAAASAAASASARTVMGRASQAITGRGSATTPRRLRLARLALTGLAGLMAIGGIAVSVVLDQQQALTEVHASQFVSATALQADLLQAQAAAATSVLETSADAIAAQQAAVDAATDDAAWQLVNISAQGTDSVDALAAISQGLLDYTQTLTLADQQRGTDAAKTTLADANDQLFTDLLPQVSTLQAAHRDVSTGVVPWWMWMLPTLAWITAAAILGVSWYAARVSHRVVNGGLAAALVATVVVAIYSGSTLFGVVSNTGEDFARLDMLSNARHVTVLTQARVATAVATQTWDADEAEGLLASLDEANGALDPDQDGDLQVSLSETAKLFTELATQATKPDWPAAAKYLTATGAGTLDTSIATIVDSTGAQLSAALGDLHGTVAARGSQTIIFGVVSTLASLAAALFAITGLHQRLREYE